MDLKTFRETCYYQTQAPCAEVLGELRLLTGIDPQEERRRTRLGTVGASSLVAAGVLFLFALISVMGDHAGTLTGVLFWMAPLLAVLGIGAYAVRTFGGRPPLEDRRHELVSRVLRLLQADIAPTEPVSLKLDLRLGGAGQQLVGTSTTPRGWSVKRFVDPWLVLQGRLADGTHFQVDMAERLERRSRSKQGRSRMKHKSKQNADTTLRVRLRVKPERHPSLQRLGKAAAGAVKLPAGVRLKSLDVTADRIDLVAVLGLPWATRRSERPSVHGPQVVAMAFLSLYQFLNRARALDKKAASVG